MNFIPWRTFNLYLELHKVDRYKKNFSVKSLLTVLMYAQITEKDSLRDLEISLAVLKIIYIFGEYDL